MTGPFRSGVGVVTAYDDHVGWGTVEADGRPWEFHCTAIADGSRHVEVGARVAFVVEPRGPGRWEAADVRPAVD